MRDRFQGKSAQVSIAPKTLLQSLTTEAGRLRAVWPTGSGIWGRRNSLRGSDLATVGSSSAPNREAAYQGDPAAKSYDEIIFSYPGLFAVTVYRMAHQLWEQGIPFMPRIITEYAHSVTGIDIHPGAHIGESFFIDHGTDVVIGETTQIGRRIRLYQGVTLGALSLPRDAGEMLRNKKRHPTIEDDVIIYSGTTMLGGGTVIGARSIIGGNVWLTESVPPDTRIILKKPELIYTGQVGRKAARRSLIHFSRNRSGVNISGYPFTAGQERTVNPAHRLADLGITFMETRANDITSVLTRGRVRECKVDS